MTHGFTNDEARALEAAVRGVVEQTLASLMSIGMSRHAALQLLLLQATIRINDEAEVRRLVDGWSSSGPRGALRDC